MLFEVRSRGRTLGKRWTGLRVVRTGGRPVTFVPSCVRNVMRLVDFLPAFYAIGMLSIFVTPRNQRLGDLAAGTLIVRERSGGCEHAPRAGAPPPRARRRLGRQRGLGAGDRRPCGSSSTAAAALAARPARRARGELERRLRPRVAGAPERLEAEEFLERCRPQAGGPAG